MILCELKCILLIIPILCLNYGIYVGMFNEFKDEKGNFKKALVSDVRGMLGLYEAVHLRVNGEDILDEALAFTTTHLRSMVEHLEYPLAEQVAHALKQPIRKGSERLEARWFMSIYQVHNSTKAGQARFQCSAVPTQGGAKQYC